MNRTDAPSRVPAALLAGMIASIAATVAMLLGELDLLLFLITVALCIVSVLADLRHLAALAWGLLLVGVAVLVAGLLG